MRLQSLHPPLRRTRPAAAIVALIIAISGFEAAVHAHVPVVDGWHAATPHGGAAGDEGLNSCTICRLAHETASAPVAPGTVSEPLRLVASGANERSALALEVVALEHSPRAPPGLASR